MPVQISWDNDEQTILRWDMTNPLTAADFFSAQDETFKIGESDNPFDILVVLAPDLQLPPGFISTLSAGGSRVQRFAPQANDALIVIVGQSTATKLFLDLFLKLGRTPNWRTATTPADARRVISAARADNS
jgi:hypothetical protein